MPNTLRRGSRGDSVKSLQRALNITADGVFGDGTEAAVVRFQQANNLTPDGVVGQSTWAKLIAPPMSPLNPTDPVVPARPPNITPDPDTHETKSSWPTQAECDKFYGNPRNPNNPEEVSPTWERNNLVDITPPWQMIDEDTRKPVPHFKMHRKVKDSIDRVFARVWAHYGQSQAEIEKVSLHIWSGAFNFRPIRGGTHLSMHAYGIAIDLASSLNGLGKPYDPKHGLPQVIIDEFEHEGWTWGGRWKGRPDAMHFQASRVE